jgi:DeoR family ulaG and ulaABCDEF operon transcriptional repressor
VRVHGGARLADGADSAARPVGFHLSGTPFEQAITENLGPKQAIGRAAAALCRRAKAS